ncbi:MAG: VanZ family protein [Anaerolineae bacterium]|nr:VanZ family protein [Anaerolineae bacterium]
MDTENPGSEVLRITLWQWVWWGLAALVAVWLLWMTLRPNATVATDLAPLTEPATSYGISIFWLIDIAGNIGVFVPLGFAVALAVSTKKARPYMSMVYGGLVGAALSAAIECTQLVIPSRFSTLGDWLLNTCGAVLGALMGVLVRRYARDVTHALH